ncbi:MAG: radical SAM family heme chaperone HemW [Lachnospiraceae bacterium]|nr:radical SAM family heme chaperone HemW [Lachnospiraceae bacterium]
MELYVHIPFCVQKCKYCDFLSGNYDVKLREKYTYALISEIESYKDRFKNETITSIYVGGGTPTFLEVVFMQRIFDAIYQNFHVDENAEISMECNPGTGSLEAFKIYRHMGVNRLSIGLQSANDDELELLGRVHDFEKFETTYREARLAGFENINVDIMTGLPYQTWNKLSNTIKKVTYLKPEHISCYSLILEEGTEFYERFKEDLELREKDLDTVALPDSDMEYELYKRAQSLLEEKGYHQYEISNYAKEGMECKHNIGYWKRVPYLGVGLGAASLIDEVRYTNEGDLCTYIELCEKDESPRIEEIELSKRDAMSEYMYLGFRMNSGIVRQEFFDEFQLRVEAVFGKQIKQFEKEGLVKTAEGRIFLTEKGMDVSNRVMAEFLLD